MCLHLLHKLVEKRSQNPRRGQTGRRPRALKAGAIQRVELEKLDFIKMLQLHASSYCKATNTYCVDLMGTCLRGAWKYI